MFSLKSCFDVFAILKGFGHFHSFARYFNKNSQIAILQRDPAKHWHNINSWWEEQGEVETHIAFIHFEPTAFGKSHTALTGKWKASHMAANQAPEQQTCITITTLYSVLNVKLLLLSRFWFFGFSSIWSKENPTRTQRDTLDLLWTALWRQWVSLSIPSFRLQFKVGSCKRHVQGVGNSTFR